MFHYNFGKCKPICGFFTVRSPRKRTMYDNKESRLIWTGKAEESKNLHKIRNFNWCCVAVFSRPFLAGRAYATVHVASICHL